ncbi:hypothetical protein BC351_17290 [Paenibacillus ferrarius]|uniref:DUF2573 domain-containing protein n=1 Tax=Paenibacillus ferrarius TaxID=1469647 RepID=A0A1V4HPT0_9BACL|nr:DUF2573 family protein [Paenibacillus ferrarius]OPH60252.1 hypothetical protein BC351_17290 [Paenibacillus ferrarius]
MNTDFENEFNSLVVKTAELITGDTSPEMIEKIKIWAFFNHVHKSLPNLTSHWNQTHPEGKAEVRSIFEEIRALNQSLQAKNQEQK